MSSVSIIRNVDININSESILNENKQLLKQLNSTTAENVILKQKIKHLTNICQNHKSKYEQIQIEWQYKYNKQKLEYIQYINSLQREIEYHNFKVHEMKQQIHIIKQQSIDINDKHQKEIKLFQQELNRYNCNLKKLERGNFDQDEQMEALNNTISEKDIIITDLENKLMSTEYQQYTPHHLSSATLRISNVTNGSYSKSSSYSKSRSSVSVKYYNYTIPSLSEHPNGMRMKSKYKGSDVNVNNEQHIKWNDIGNIMHRQRGMAVDAAFSPLGTLDDDLNYDYTPDLALSLSQYSEPIMSRKCFPVHLIEKSETDTSPDDDDLNEQYGSY